MVSVTLMRLRRLHRRAPPHARTHAASSSRRRVSPLRSPHSRSPRRCAVNGRAAQLLPVLLLPSSSLRVEESTSIPPPPRAVTLPAGPSPSLSVPWRRKAVVAPSRREASPRTAKVGRLLAGMGLPSITHMHGEMLPVFFYSILGLTWSSRVYLLQGARAATSTMCSAACAVFPRRVERDA